MSHSSLLACTCGIAEKPPRRPGVPGLLCPLKRGPLSIQLLSGMLIRESPPFKGAEATRREAEGVFQLSLAKNLKHVISIWLVFPEIICLLNLECVLGDHRLLSGIQGDTFKKALDPGYFVVKLHLSYQHRRRQNSGKTNLSSFQLCDEFFVGAQHAAPKCMNVPPWLICALGCSMLHPYDNSSQR